MPTAINLPAAAFRLMYGGLGLELRPKCDKSRKSRILLTVSSNIYALLINI